MVDRAKVEAAIKLLLEGIGEDVNREGLIDTPDRVARMYEEICGGLDETPEEHLSKIFTASNDEIVIEKDITFYSLCEHHLMPFYGKAHIAYIPDGKVGGLCKTSADSGAAHLSGSICDYGVSEAEGCHGIYGSRAHVHDHAWN